MFCFHREKVRELENLLRRKDSELNSQRTRINQLQTSLRCSVWLLSQGFQSRPFLGRHRLQKPTVPEPPTPAPNTNICHFELIKQH